MQYTITPLLSKVGIRYRSSLHRQFRIGIQTTINSSIKLKDVQYHPKLFENTLKNKKWNTNRVLFSNKDEENNSDSNNNGLPEGRNPGTQPIGIVEMSLSQLQTVLCTKAFPIAFLRALRSSKVRIHENPKLLQGKSGQEVVADIKRLCSSLIEVHKDMIVDNASKGMLGTNFLHKKKAHLAMSCLMLASYKVLSNRGCNHEEAISILHNSFVSNIKVWLQALVEWPMFTNKPIRFLTATFDKIVRLRGKGFHIEIQDDKYYNSYLHVIVKRCFFNEFFKKTGHSYLTSLFCAAEAKMLEGIDPLKYNVRLDIPRTLAEGYKCCSFQFKRMQFLGDLETTQ